MIHLMAELILVIIFYLLSPKLRLCSNLKKIHSLSLNTGGDNKRKEYAYMINKRRHSWLYLSKEHVAIVPLKKSKYLYIYRYSILWRSVKITNWDSFVATLQSETLVIGETGHRRDSSVNFSPFLPSGFFPRFLSGRVFYPAAYTHSGPTAPFVVFIEDPRVLPCVSCPWFFRTSSWRLEILCGGRDTGASIGTEAGAVTGFGFFCLWYNRRGFSFF